MQAYIANIVERAPPASARPLGEAAIPQINNENPSLNVGGL